MHQNFTFPYIDPPLPDAVGGVVGRQNGQGEVEPTLAVQLPPQRVQEVLHQVEAHGLALRPLEEADHGEGRQQGAGEAAEPDQRWGLAAEGLEEMHPDHHEGQQGQGGDAADGDPLAAPGGGAGRELAREHLGDGPASARVCSSAKEHLEVREDGPPEA